MDTNSSVKDIDEVTKQATVSIPADTVLSEFKEAIDRLSKTAHVKGFRPGKAPTQVLEKLHGKRVHMEVANRLISSSLHDLLKELNLDVVGQPEIEVSSFEPGQEITYTANISLLPKPTIEQYASFNVSVEKREVNDQDIENVVERLLTARSTNKPLEFRNTVNEGDIIDASLLVSIEGEEPSRPEPLVVGLGEGRLPEELEKAMIGQEVGTSREVEVTHAEDYSNEQLRGKKVTYKISLNSISEKVAPELTDEFVKGLGEEFETVIELRLHIRKQLEEQVEQASKEDVQQAVLEQLLDANPFKIPQILIDDEIRSLLVRSGYVDPNKVNPAMIPVDELRKDFGEMAEKRVKTVILVDRLGDQESISALEDDIDSYMERVSEQNGLPVPDIKKFLLDGERRQSTLREITRDKVLEFLVGRAEVTYTEPKEEDPAQEAAEGSKE